MKENKECVEEYKAAAFFKSRACVCGVCFLRKKEGISQPLKEMSYVASFMSIECFCYAFTAFRVPRVLVHQRFFLRERKQRMCERKQGGSDLTCKQKTYML